MPKYAQPEEKWKCLLDAALAYTSIGWRIFPLSPRSKQPAIPKSEGGNGLHDATNDSEQIRSWWKRWPNANLGLNCGMSGVTVIDIDGLEGGAWLGDLVEENSAFDTHPFAITRKGGHIYFAAPADKYIKSRQQHPVPGLDVRGTAGQAVLPPSVHKTGHVYRWEPAKSPWDVSPPAMPDWLAELLGDAQAPQTLPETVLRPAKPYRQRSTLNNEAYASAALDGACKAIVNASDGKQQDTLTAQAFSIGRLVGGNMIDRHLARTKLIEAGIAMPSFNRWPWSRHEIEMQVDRKISQGIVQPRNLEGAA